MNGAPARPPAVSGPLAGLRVACPAAGPEAAVAASVLVGLGATTADGVAGADVVIAGPGPAGPGPTGPGPAGTGPAGGPAAVLVPHPLLGDDLPGLPAGTLCHATGLTLASAALAAVRCGGVVTVAALDVAVQLLLPPVMAAAYGSPRWPEPPAPVRPPSGRGWLNAELGAPGAADDYARLLATLPAEADAEQVAAAAQEWRLPVVPYRPRPASVPPPRPVAAPPARTGTADRAAPAVPPPRDGERVAPGAGGATGGGPLAGVVVCDLTAMWAGPLATWLLGRLGATVLKVEPDCRPDGMRAPDGRGVHPDGVHRGDGDSALFNALNADKARLPLDVRIAPERRRLLDVIATADVVIDSFSPRVMPNLGLTRSDIAADDPRRVTLSVPAFPAGPMRQWVGYGTAAHAVAGLGDLGDGTAGAPAVTYPDPLAGLAACAGVLAALVGRGHGWVPTHLEVSLLGATLPLLAWPAAPSLLRARDADLGRRLFDAGRAAGCFAPVDLVGAAGGPLPHPVGPFRVAGQRPPGAAPLLADRAPVA